MAVRTPSLILLLVVFPNAGFACKCPPIPDVERLDNAKAVFHMVVLETRLVDTERRHIEVKYRVIEDFKMAASVSTIRDMYTSCSLQFQPGEEWIVFVPRQEIRGLDNVVDQCSGSFRAAWPGGEGEFWQRTNDRTDALRAAAARASGIDVPGASK